MSTITETQYDQLVREGREARETADNVQWVEGDLALQVETLAVNERPRDPETGDFIADPDRALKHYADDIEVNYSTLQRYRWTAAAWPRTSRARASWRVHHDLRTLDDRFDLIRDDMTSREAAKVVRERNGRANTGGKPGWHELLGRVGDSLTDALKHLDAIEAAITHEPNAQFTAKAQLYADRADDVATRLRKIHLPPESVA